MVGDDHLLEGAGSRQAELPGTAPGRGGLDLKQADARETTLKIRGVPTAPHRLDWAVLVLTLVLTV